jgi:hypothetical protein
MTKEFIPYEQALELKELGFDEPCFGWYSNMEGNVLRQGYCETYLGIENCAKSPLYQQVFRWFRKKYNIVSSVRTHFNEEFFYEIYVDVMNEITSNYYKTYEESELECIKKLIEICKNK